MLPETLATHQHWRRLVSQHAVLGVQVHDAMLAAVMHVHGVTHLLTFNKPDFKRYQGVVAINPADVKFLGRQPDFPPAQKTKHNKA